ncbi:CRISPR-associated helicase Cas3' [Dehalococcoidia bacterium]|nr:CRISPR-associated helicase Cas3' [Dehalococcoidia bacterium]
MGSKVFLAHSQNSEGQGHSLVQHLESVGNLAQQYAAKFGAGELGRWVGLWHDLGKFNPRFQEYICNPEAAHGRIDHSSAGAVFAAENFEPLAFLVAGHHGGLPDGRELKHRLKRKSGTAEIHEALSLARGELSQVVPQSRLKGNLPAFLGNNPSETQFELFLRMLFSALVDADFLDTEAHLNPSRMRERGSNFPSLQELWQLLEDHQNRISGKNQDALNQIRDEIYRACLQAAPMPPGIFRLTAPTGGGKTLSSMAFALKHALEYNLNRVIVAIPYTSIIDQTAKVYRDIFGEEVVLEHHSAVNWDSDSELPNTRQMQARLASENWDAPIVVTTTVQLFESLFANRASRCRKLHNIVRSVLILDEVQMLPTELLAPILDVLQDLADHYSVTVVLCSATQPAFEDSPYVRGFREIRDIVPNPDRYFDELKRVHYELPQGGEWSWEQVATKMHLASQCMAVVNTKKDALALLDALNDPNALHLSTLLCGAHRRDVLAEVHNRLHAGKPCRLVATQVVEAGVDLDFPVVLRAMGPLDRIVQAAGRCNREGLLDQGQVIVFVPSAGSMPSGSYSIGAGTTRALVAQGDIDLHRPAIYQTYFERLYQRVELDKKNIQKKRAKFDFAEVAQSFRLIEEDSEPVIVRYQSSTVNGEVDALLKEARRADVNSRWLVRRLQPYLVNVKRWELPRMQREGLVKKIFPGLWEWLGKYDPVRGLVQSGHDPEDLVV